MAKTLHRFNLTARTETGEVLQYARMHKRPDPDHFLSDNKYFRVEREKSTLRVITTEGTYYLQKHPSMNQWQGVCKGVKVHVSLKKLVGELRAWY